MFPGGSLKFVAPGDTYKDPTGNEKGYDRCKIVIAIVGAKQPFEITREAYDALVRYLQEEDVKKKMRDWFE